LRKLRDLVNARAVTAAIVYDPDRLSRNLGHQLLLAEEFERAGVKLLIVSHPMEQGPEGWLFFQMRGALAEYERAKILERTKRGLLGRAKAGHVNGGRVPLGYRYVSAPHQGRLEVDEEEAVLVRQIFQWCVEGLSLRAIAGRLTEACIPTAIDRRGYQAKEGRKPCKLLPVGVWHVSSVGLILRNPVHKGQMRYNARVSIRRNGQLVSQRWRPQEEWLLIPVPAIIDPEIFAAVQQQLRDNRHLWPSRRGTALLRSRWFRCGRCGWGMAPVTANGHHYYRCSSQQAKIATEHRCGGVIRADVADRQVWAAVMRLLEQPEVVTAEVAKQQATIHDQEASIGQELTTVDAALARCQHDDQRLVEAYVAGAFTATELKVYRADIMTKRRSLEVHHQALLTRRAALQHTLGQADALVDYCARVRERLQTFSLEEQHCAFDALAMQATWLPNQPLRIQASLIVEASTSPRQTR
jgi:site-specific DNA recombinase